MTPESKLKQKLRLLLQGQGLWQTIETTTGRGVPDVAFLCQAGTVWIEVKWVHGNLTLVRPEQINWFWKAVKQKGECLVVAGTTESLHITDMRKLLSAVTLDIPTTVVGKHVYYILPSEYSEKIPYYALQDYFKNL